MVTQLAGNVHEPPGTSNPEARMNQHQVVPQHQGNATAQQTHIPELQRQDAFSYPGENRIAPNLDTESWDPDIDVFERVQWEGIITKWGRFFNDFETGRGTPIAVYNRRCYSFALTNIMQILNNIHEMQMQTYKVQIQAGFVLRNITENTLSYFFCSNNTSLLPKPMPVLSKQGLARIKSTLKGEDITGKCLARRDGSSSVFFCSVNLMFFVYRMGSFIRGEVISTRASSYLRSCRYVFSFLQPWVSPCCFFYCLEAFLQSYNVRPSRVSKISVKHHLKQFMKAKKLKQFKGVRLSDLSLCETLFDLGIQVVAFEFQPGRVKPVVFTIRKAGRFKRTMYLGLTCDHFFAITQPEMLASLHECVKCGKIDNRLDNFKRHQAVCKGETQVKYQSGYFLPKSSIISQLEKAGVVNIDPKDFQDNSVVVFDFEVGLQKVDEGINTAAKLMLTEKHSPITVAVTSNVPGHTDPVVFVELADPLLLMERFIKFCLSASEHARRLFYDRVDYAFQQLTDMEVEYQITGNIERANQIANVEKRLKSYVARLPVVGFNSSSYDLRAAKSTFFSKLLELDGIDICIKKDGSYLCVASSNLRFVDVCKYLGPGSGGLTSYLKCYGNGKEGGKLFFPYSVLDKPGDLYKMKTPPVPDAFYSEIAGGNTLSLEFDAYMNLRRLGVRKSEALSKLSLAQLPPTQKENYAKFVGDWRANKCSNMLDYLQAYNLSDVVPMLSAVKNHQQFYFDKNIHMFREHSTLPSLCLPYLFSYVKPEDYFVLLDEETNTLFRRNLFGGLSVIVTRFAETHSTHIKTHVYGDTSPKCQRITCVDANMLYGSCLSLDMFCGPYIVRNAANGFKPNPGNRGSFTIQFVEYLAFKLQTPVQHALTPEGEFSAHIGGRLCFADGYFPDKRLWVEVNTCSTHACPSCFPNRNKMHPLVGKPYKAVYEDSRQRTDDIAKVYKVEVYWECDLKEKYRRDAEFHSYCKHSCIGGGKISRRSYTESEVIDAIRSGFFFGAVLCSASVPQNLHAQFDQYPPIICRKKVSLKDAGDKMISIAESLGITKLDREQLVGSFSGENILFSTSMLTWLIDHGVEIFQIQKVIQFTRKRPFSRFTDAIAGMRQDAEFTDNPILGASAKAIGNSSYGFTLYSPQRSIDTKFILDNAIQKYFRSKRFVSLEKLSEGVYELCMKKDTVTENLPIQIGFQVYALSKTYMLEFVHDVLGKHLRDDHWEILSSDTDSICMSLAYEDIDRCVKPEMMASWLSTKYRYFVDGRNDKLLRKTAKKPFLFKEEIVNAERFYGLNSKCSYAATALGPKISAKGVNKKQNNLTEQMFRDTLFGDDGEHKYKEVTNFGFRAARGNIYSYRLTKKGLSPIYIKRKVLDNIVSTTTIA